MNEAIVQSLLRALSDNYHDIATQPGLCLAWVRRVVEYGALGGRDRAFYDKFLVAGTSRRGGTEAQRLQWAWQNPWASDVEASMKKLGLQVPAMLRKGGDLVFNHNAAVPMGHVGILLDREWVVELVNPDFRPASAHLPGSVCLTRYGDWPVTLVARLR